MNYLSLYLVLLTILQVLHITYSQFIDIFPLFLDSTSKETKETITKEIDFYLQKHGYFITEHPILTIEFQKSIESAAKSLFNHSNEMKQEYSIKQLNSIGRGFLPFGAEAGVQSYYEIKEGFSYGYPGKINDIQPHPMQQSNIWPPFISNQSQQAFEKLFLEKATFCKLLLSLLAQHINTEQISSNDDDDNVSLISFDIKEGGETISLMRIFHYFSGTDTHDSININGSHSSRTLIGSSPHTDWGLLTVITYNGVSGLQFYDQVSKEWNDLVIPIHIQNPVVINAGDYLKLVSNNRYHSPIHRVLCPLSTIGSSDKVESKVGLKDRTSFVFFYYPPPDTILPSISNTAASPIENLNDTCNGHGTCEDINKSSSDATCCQKDDNKNDEKIVNVESHFKDFEFNTLMPLDSSSSFSSCNITFGDYIMAKWKGVYQ